MAKGKENIINLNNWLYEDRSDEEKRELFLKLSSAQKDLNNHGYGISSFNLNDIYLENDNINTINFDSRRKLPDDINERRRIVSEEIFILVLMQVGIYTDCLNSINVTSIKENFNLFLPFLPTEDVAYYKSVLDSHINGEDNCVYFVDYASELERRKKVSNSGQELEEGSNSKDTGKTLAKINGNKRIDLPDDNSVYDKYKNAAYINFVAIPIGVVIAGLILTIISWLIN